MRDHRETQRKTDEQVQREVAALRESPGPEAPRASDAATFSSVIRSVAAGALVPLVERRDDRRAIPLEPAPQEDDGGDERDQQREEQTHATDVANQPRQVATERVSKNAERRRPRSTPPSAL